MKPKKEIILSGHQFTVYSMGWFERMTSRSSVQLRRLQREKIIPAPIIEVGNGMRWYLADELIRYSAAYKGAKIKVGVPKESTGIKRTLALIKAELLELVKKSPERLTKRLPSEELIGQTRRTENPYAMTERIENNMHAKLKGLKK